MSPFVIITGALVLILLIFVAIAVFGLKRRKRLWFVGGGKSAASRLAELKTLQLRELRDLEDGFGSNKIEASEYAERKHLLLQEISQTSLELQTIEAAREGLRKRFTLPILLVGAFMLSLFAGSLGAQQALEVMPEYHAELGVGTVNLTLSDALNPARDFSDIVVVARVLEDNEMPYNELLQANWTPAFHRIAALAVPLVESVDEAAPKVAPRGYAWRSNAAGAFTVNSLLTQRRIAFAALLDGMWWPLASEMMLPESGAAQPAKINVSGISRDLTPLVIDDYEVEVIGRDERSIALRWHQLIVRETITIRNPTDTAIAGPTNDQGEAWLTFQIPAPPDLSGAELLTMLSSSWSYFIGTPEAAADQDRAAKVRNVAPYKPWSKGLEWGTTTSHGANQEHQYANTGAKDSGAYTHPLNLDGQQRSIGAGDIIVVAQDGGIQINIYKPVPARATMVVRLIYQPGMDFSKPMPVRIDRSNLPAEIRALRAIVDRKYDFVLDGATLAASPEVSEADRLYTAKTNASGVVAAPDAPLSLTISATPAFTKFLSAIKESSGANHPTSTSQAMAGAGSNIPESEKPSGGLVFASLMWLLAAIFGLGCLISIVWVYRTDRDAQLKRIEAEAVSEADGIAELSAMREEVEAGALPPNVYLAERNRIIEGMISAKLLEVRDKSPNNQKTK